MFFYGATERRGGFGGLGVVRSSSPREEIRQLQRQLNYYSDANLTEDGIFGARTLQAVQYWEIATNVPIEYRNTGGYEVSDYTLATLGIYGNTSGGANGGSTTTVGGGNNDRVRFEWVAPAIVNATSLTTWTAAQEAFGNNLRGNGFTVEYNSYQFNSVFGAAWSIVVRGISPSGYTDKDSLNNLLIGLAENSGFNVDIGAESLTLGGRIGNAPGSGDGGANNDDDNGSGFKLGAAGVLLIGLVAAVAIMRRD